ncbi:MAG: urease subunit beta [Candidatus Scalindua sp.]|jgi:urease beta subunit|nr:urease subunit beta [Candidatus Neomarinimicrobiota bacterium]MDV5120946.1 urease subunit beta [Candidatus Scalindua sp.]|tara:strand:- start:8150 stop:8521 length:372 start_codon:yes stop_codon:yes gene_type:complete
MSETVEYIVGHDPIEINAGRVTLGMSVRNTGDRPIQVGSHFHFFETNKALDFDRRKSFGMRLNIPAGTSIRFEPGDEKMVELVQLGGKRVVMGLNGLVNGSTSEKGALEAALKKAKELGFKGA